MTAKTVRRLIATAGLMALLPITAASAAEDLQTEQVGYRVALAGINVADLDLQIRRSGDRYDVQAQGSYRVLFWSGALSSTVSGKIVPNGLQPDRYKVSTESSSPSTTVIEFEPAQGPTSWERTPVAPSEWTEGRVPLERDHLKPALDPISAIVVSALWSANGATPTVCEEAIRIFTGLTVFELDFDGAQPDGYDRVICDVTYRALSGHRAESSGVKRLSGPGTIEIAFDRLPGGNWFPGYISLPTGVGKLTIQRS
ncbi:MAG: DUF3108 domain-containing protein [Pseudomonadota bacterium]